MSYSTAEIFRFRGDTVPDQITVTNNGVAVNIAGYSFRLSVNTLKDPPDITTELFQMVGSITNPSGGVVQFTPSPAQANQAIGSYYYDIEMVDTGGKVKTIAKGKYKFGMDVTKTN